MVKFPSALVVLIICGGCLPDKASYAPYSYAPSTAQSYWFPPDTIHNKRRIELTYPKQDGPPLTLAEILDLALRNNTQTQISWAQARQAAAKYGQSQVTINRF